MTTPGELCLQVDDVTVNVGGHPVLQGIDLVFRAGEAVALTGPSGSGKTVLCLLLAGALEPASGRIRTSGAPSGDPPPGPGRGGREEVTTGIILQTHGLVAGLTAEENVALPLQSRGVPREETARRTGQALADVGLTRHAARPVDELSGGERQRVGIARALASDPAILVADEPTAELDPENRARVLDLLTALARRGRIVVIASDDPEVVAICGRSVSLQAGRIVDASERALRADATPRR